MNKIVNQINSQDIGEQKGRVATLVIDLFDEDGLPRKKSLVVSDIMDDFQKTNQDVLHYVTYNKSIDTTKEYRFAVSKKDVLSFNNKPDWDEANYRGLLMKWYEETHIIELMADGIKSSKEDLSKGNFQDFDSGKSEDVDASQPLPLAYLLHLNITRFGTITMVGIALGILVPLYRFSARLSAFYLGLADALRLQQGAYKQTGFVRLAATLIPQFDFGKTQAMTSQIVELAKMTASESKRDES